ncbi:D-alanine--D-alanine ligase family protein [Austwickia sp. TVS 96-490-7B]|uniref:D-alanine--D-alanine ligase family protein n=1 Tax=Austwickia sp. TVS 96-490-7B TaxID=2830843 RepID=UPI001C579451|nr:D-alanine--D-alanine ligase family protein [Austwickia sp. TVS 96-490-7B]
MSTQQPRKPRVALVFGGRSSEHPVSCVTAASVMAAVDRDRYEVVPIGITREGKWLVHDGDLSALTFSGSQLPQVLGEGVEVAVPLSQEERGLRAVGHDADGAGLRDVEVVFPLLHGPFGEDGTLQGMLDLADVRYVGSGVLASAVMMDKHYMKVVFAAAGLTVGPYQVITDKDWCRDSQAALDRCAQLQFPLYVKPCRAGSSVGITRVEHAEELRAAVEAAREHDPKVIVEEGIFGREIECGVLEGHHGEPDRASPLGEIVVEQGHAFYDFEAKYLDGDDVRLSCPAVMPEADAEHIREQAIRAFHAAGCEGLARVDFFYTPQGQIIINEINTMPGFTPFSMYPRLWQEAGISYTDLISELIELALERRTGLR